MNLLERINSYTKKFTSADLLILNFVKNMYPHGMLGPARIISEKVGVSTATVIRFFDKLGYESYSQLQSEARAEVSAKLSSPLDRVSLTGSDYHSTATILNDSFTLDAGNLERTYKRNPAANFQLFISNILKAASHRLFIMGGTMNTGSVAQYLYAGLNLCLPEAILLSGDDGTLADKIISAKNNDTLFVVSMRRYSANSIKVANYFKNKGCTIISITDSTDSPVSKLSKVSLYVDMASTSPFDSYTAAFSLCNAIVGAVASQRRKHVEESLRLGENAWHDMQVFQR